MGFSEVLQVQLLKTLVLKNYWATRQKKSQGSNPNHGWKWASGQGSLQPPPQRFKATLPTSVLAAPPQGTHLALHMVANVGLWVRRATCKGASHHCRAGVQGIDPICGFAMSIQCANALKNYQSLTSDMQSTQMVERGLESVLLLSPKPLRSVLWWLPGHLEPWGDGTSDVSCLSAPKAVTLDLKRFHQRWGLAACLTSSESTR